MRGNLPEQKELFLGKTMPRHPGYVIEEFIASGNNGLLFRAFNSEASSNLAFKIVPIANLPAKEGDQHAYLQEARNANRLEHQSVVRCIDVFLYSDSDNEIQSVVFVYDYVKGINLREYMQKQSSDISIRFIESFLRTMFEVLYELQRRGYQHGDLHAGNILVAKSEYDIHERTNFRITDFGVWQLSEQPIHASDYLSVAETLRLLLECMDYRACESRDRYAYRILHDSFLRRHLIETDTTVDPLACDPAKMLHKLDSIDGEYQKSGQGITSRLVTPFDYPNCEQMEHSHLLLKNLYSDHLLGLPEIQKRSNLVLTGPRGCGKTTVFRALCLDYLLSVNGDNPDSIDYIGVYYRCDDLYFSFPRYSLPKRPEALDIPMHFLIVTLLATALEKIKTWAKNISRMSSREERRYSLQIYGISSVWCARMTQVPASWRHWSIN